MAARTRTQQGLTLLELLVTIAMMAILLTIAVPSYRESIRQNRLTVQIGGFVAALRLAQSEAIRLDQMVTLCKSSNPEATTTPACDNATTWDSGWVLFVDANGDGIIDTGESIIRVGAPLVAGSSLLGSSAVADVVTYRPTSEIAAAGTFVLCDNNDMTHARAVFLATNGRIRLAERNSSGTPVDDSGTALTSCNP